RSTRRSVTSRAEEKLRRDRRNRRLKKLEAVEVETQLRIVMLDDRRRERADLRLGQSIDVRNHRVAFHIMPARDVLGHVPQMLARDLDAAERRQFRRAGLPQPLEADLQFEQSLEARPIVDLPTA